LSDKNYITKNYFPDRFLHKVIQKKTFSKKKKQQLPKISIVMPSLNHEKFIERSILSVLNQGYPNLQFIIIDGGSNDATTMIIKKYEKYIDYWVSERDQGQSDALNRGFRRANGEIYGWLNSDDLYLPNSFFASAKALQNHPDKLVVYGDWLFISETDKIVNYYHAFDFNINHFKYEGFHLSAQSMFWRASLHKKFGKFDLNLNYTMDYQMILEFGLLSKKGFLRIPKVLGAFRIHEEQKTKDRSLKKIIKEHMYMAKKYHYMDKYFLIGTFKRYFFHLRRALWYKKRVDFKYLFNRFVIFLKNKLLR